MRFHKLQNVQIALDYLKYKGVSYHADPIEAGPIGGGGRGAAPQVLGGAEGEQRPVLPPCLFPQRLCRPTRPPLVFDTVSSGL